jgi:hypothetical protein
VFPSPKLVTVTYAGFPYESEVETFGDFVVTSSWLATVGADYGVGQGTHTHVTLPESPPATVGDGDIQAMLRQKLADGVLPGGLRSADGGYIYLVFYPPGTSLSSSKCVSDATGNFVDHDWHLAVDDGSGRFVYVVVGTCNGQSLHHLTLQASHELIEAATDPLPVTQPTYRLPESSGWSALGGENGDLCEVGAQNSVTEGGFTLQRIWSNRQAAAGQVPCVPAPPGEEFAVVRPVPDSIYEAPAGTSLQVTLEGWATGPVTAWQANAVSATLQGSGSFVLGASASPFDAGVSETTLLSVEVPAGTPSGAVGALFLASFLPGDGGRPINVSGWPLVVRVP